MLKTFFAVGLGGALGSILRFALGLWYSRFADNRFPYATLTVNVIGCFLIGFIFSLSNRTGSLPREWQLFLITGFCGGFTTFSAFAQENMLLLQKGDTVLFFLNTIGTFALTLIAVWAGASLGKVL